MNRANIRDHVRRLADELTESPEGLFTDPQLNDFINIALQDVYMDLLDFLPWYFRKEVQISLISSKREYRIDADLGIDGNIVITTANNKLDFDEGGAELTATITAGSYTPSTLCTEIKIQMDAAGAATYTVTYSGKVFRIASNGATLNLRCNTGTNAANGIWTTIGFSTAANKTGYTNYAGDYYIDVQNFLMFETILQRESGGKSNPLIYLDPKDLFLHETVGQTAAPSAVKYWGYKDIDEVFFIPTPNANASNQLLGYYFTQLGELTNDTDSPALPRTSHELVALAVLRNWYIRDGDKAAGSIDGRYTKLLTTIQLKLGNPQGPRPGKRPGVPEIAGTSRS